MTDTVRKKILNYLQTMFTNIVATEPLGDPYGIAFSVVAIGPLADWDARKQYALGIVAGKEKKSFLYPYEQCQFTVHIEFKATWNRGDSDPGEIAEDVLGVIQRAVMNDRTLGGMVIDTKERGNEIDLTTYADRTIVGVVHWEIEYRTSQADPRSSLPAPGN